MIYEAPDLEEVPVSDRVGRDFTDINISERNANQRYPSEVLVIMVEL
jgi:hypothetical protein